MAKKAKQNIGNNAIGVLVGNVVGDPGTKKMAAEFAMSSQSFIDCLQIMRDKLEGQFERYSDDDGRTFRQRWNPPEYFNCWQCSHFARKTYEAWYVARRLNKELESFDGEKLWALVLVFETMHMEQIKPSGVPTPEDLPAVVHRFKCEFERFEMLLELKNKPPIVVNTTRTKSGPRNAARDSQWYDWRHSECMTDAKIRDRWNAENTSHTISNETTKKAGRELVKKAIGRMEKLKQSGDK